MLLNVAWSINSAEWAEGLAVLQWVALVGLVIGFILAKSRLPGFVAHFLSLIGGTAWVTFLISTLLPSTLNWTEKLQPSRPPHHLAADSPRRAKQLG